VLKTLKSCHISGMVWRITTKSDLQLLHAKRVSDVQNWHDADANWGLYWQQLANMIEPSMYSSLLSNYFEHLLLLPCAIVTVHHTCFTALFPGPPWWDGARRKLLDFWPMFIIVIVISLEHSTGVIRYLFIQVQVKFKYSMQNLIVFSLSAMQSCIT